MKKTSQKSFLTKEEQYILSNITITKEQIKIAKSLTKEQIKSAINLKNDLIFRLVFGTKGNEKITKDFLEGILDTEIDSVELDQNPIVMPDIFNEKVGILDVKVKLKDGTIIDLEMQNSNEHNLIKRAHFYICRVYSKQIDAGVNYANLKKTIGIFILNYDLLNDNKDFKTTYKMTNVKDINDSLDELELHFIELPKFEKARPDANNKLNQWLYYLSDLDEEAIAMAVQSNAAIKEADTKIRKMKEEEALKYLAYLKMKGELDYNSNMKGAREEGRREGILIGEKRGKEQGIRLQKNIVAKKLLNLGLSVSNIAQITELSEEEVKKLQKL